MNRRRNDKSSFYLILSLLVHASIALAVATAPALKMVPEGTVPVQVEFTTTERPPQGNQITTLDVGPSEEIAPTQPEPVVIKKQKAKKPEPPKKVAKKEQPLKLKPVATETVEDSPVPVVVPEKDEAPIENVVEEDLKMLDERFEEEEKDSDDVGFVAAQEEVDSEPQPTPAPEPTVVPGPPKEKAQNLRRQSNLNYGVPTGVRDYRELRQVPGNQPPQYPEMARKRREMGQVHLMYFVTSEGYVTSIQVSKSSGHQSLDSEAVRAIKKYRFYPGQQGYTSHLVNFNLVGEAQEAGGRLRTSRYQQN